MDCLMDEARVGKTCQEHALALALNNKLTPPRPPPIYNISTGRQWAFIRVSVFGIRYRLLLLIDLEWSGE